MNWSESNCFNVGLILIFRVVLPEPPHAMAEGGDPVTATSPPTVAGETETPRRPDSSLTGDSAEHCGRDLTLPASNNPTSTVPLSGGTCIYT